jgi:hypothetical protein
MISILGTDMCGEGEHPRPSEDRCWHCYRAPPIASAPPEQAGLIMQRTPLVLFHSPTGRQTGRQTLRRWWSSSLILCMRAPDYLSMRDTTNSRLACSLPMDSHGNVPSARDDMMVCLVG